MFFFFFSSRRRHTRCGRDWSSDVCSSDLSKIGLAVRGLYGEGTEAMGNLFQISNQTTLGEKEDEIINRLSKVIETIIEKEHDARQILLQKKPNTLCHQMDRDYGVLT